jgi:hypothetical protein
MFKKFLAFIVTSVINFITGVIDKLPNIDFDIPESALSGFAYIAQYINYFVPVAELMPILVMTVSLSVFHIVWAIILRIKSFIPTMGG